MQTWSIQLLLASSGGHIYQLFTRRLPKRGASVRRHQPQLHTLSLHEGN